MRTKFYTKNKYGRTVAIPAVIEETEDEYRIQFPFNRSLIDDIKESTEKRQWDGDRKQWVLKKSLRNERYLAFLQGINIYERYDTELRLSSSDPLITDMWTHQKKMYAHMAQRRQVIVAGEMRTGKTLPTLRLLTKTYDSNEPAPLFVAPKSALKGLRNELTKWGYTNPITLMTYEKFSRVYEDVVDSGSLNLVPKVIVFDECQKLKNPKSNRGRVARQLTALQEKKYKGEQYTILLSGTPSPKEPSDWFNLTEVAFAGFLKEGSKYNLKNKLANMEQREGNIGQMYWHLISWKTNEVERLHRRLNGLVEVFLKKDCLDLPKKIYTITRLEVSTQYKKAMALVRKDPNLMAANLLDKLRQLSDGFIYTKEYNDVTGKEISVPQYFDNCPKDEQLKTDLRFFEDVGRIVIYVGYQASLDKVTKLCLEEDWAVLQVSGKGWNALNTHLDSDELLKEMSGSDNQGIVPKLAFVAQADSASTGIELSASPVVIYYSNSYNGDARMQSEDRPYSNNMDKARGLEIIDYIHLPTDELVRDNLLTKKTLQGITLGEINELIGDVIK